MQSPQLLIDVTPIRMSVVESKDGSKLFIRGSFGHTTKPTDNGRLYNEELWTREIGRLREDMAARRTFGELDHPADGKTKLQRVSHLLTNLRIEGEDVVGEMEILPTPMGKILEALARANAQFGVSSRGYGSTSYDKDGNEVVGEDYRLMTFDAVADPASRNAYPAVYAEAKEVLSAEEKALAEQFDSHGLLAQIQEQIQREDELLSTICAPISEDDDKPDSDDDGDNGDDDNDDDNGDDDGDEKDEKKESISELDREGLTRQVFEELARLADEPREVMESPDPEADAGAQRVLEAIANVVMPFAVPGEVQSLLDERDQRLQLQSEEIDRLRDEVQDVTSDRDLLKGKVRELMFHLRVESKTRGLAVGETVRALLMHPEAQYESLEELDGAIEALAKKAEALEPEPASVELEKKVEALTSENAGKDLAIEELQGKLKEAEEKAEEAASAVVVADTKVESIQGDLAKAKQDIDSITEKAERLHFMVQVERKIAGLPNADVLREQAYNAENLDAVETIITEDRQARSFETDEARRISRRVARSTESLPEPDPKRNGDALANDVGGALQEELQGTNLAELQRLSGIDPGHGKNQG